MSPPRPRILIVDDQSANVEVLAEALGESYELFAATSAERALVLAGKRVDLILLDVLMPDRNGFEVCRALKANELTRGIPVIFVTALGEVEDEARGFEAGGVDYIAKPISPPTVRARVRTHLELRGALKRLEKEAEILSENLRLKEHVERLSRHDLKTPLTSVISLPQILLETAAIGDEEKGMLRAIEAAGYRILDMINRSLDLFRMESGTYEFEAGRVDLADLAERVALDLGAIARARAVTLDLQRPHPSEPPAVAWAEELLSYSMLANLMKNAIEAAPPGTEVRVQAVVRGPEACVEIHNRGAVPLALRDSFFRKYASSGKKTGSGLGAYSARLMAETQHGRIEMTTSDDLGGATTIAVCLEAAPALEFTAPRTAAETSEIRRMVLPSLRVLIVDDDEPTRFILSRFLQGALGIAMAAGAEEALERAADFDPMVILLDAEMPGMDGFALAARLRAQEAGMGRARRFLIGLSSHDDEATRNTFADAGCDLVLVKPVGRPSILAAIEAAVALPGPMPSPAGKTGGDVVWVDADLLPLIPAFLESRREQARELEAALEAGERASARALAHKLRGGLEMCGFALAGSLSQEIEEALAGNALPPEAMAARARALSDYLRHVQYQSVTHPKHPEGE